MHNRVGADAPVRPREPSNSPQIFAFRLFFLRADRVVGPYKKHAPVGADADIGPLETIGFAEDFRISTIFSALRTDPSISRYYRVLQT